MKNVVSYRTNDLDELKKIAKIRNVSLSTITGEIIQDYLKEHKITKKYDMFLDSRKFISAACENLDSSIFDEIAEIGANELARGAKMSMNNFSLDNLLSSFRGWLQLNNLRLVEFNEDKQIRWICETKMGKNYNEISGKSFKKVLERFGYRTNLESFSDEQFEIVFLKQKRIER